MLMAASNLDEFVARAQTLVRQATIDRAALDTIKALHATGIETLLLKGPVLARTLYRADEHRGYFDIDLLVAPDHHTAAGRVLEGLGYVDFVKSTNLPVFRDDPHADLWTRRSDTGVIAVDLHWRLPGCGRDPRHVWETLAARRAWIELEGAETPTLDRPALALHLALHATLHGPEDRKAIGDLARGIDRWPLDVWTEAALLAAEVGATEALSAGVRLLPQGAALATDLGLPDASVLLRQIEERKSRPRGAFHLQALRDAVGLRTRASVLRQSLVPPALWIRREYPWVRGSRSRLAAAYALHLARTPYWASRAWRMRERRGRRQVS